MFLSDLFSEVGLLHNSFCINNHLSWNNHHQHKELGTGENRVTNQRCERLSYYSNDCFTNVRFPMHRVHAFLQIVIDRQSDLFLCILGVVLYLCKLYQLITAGISLLQSFNSEAAWFSLALNCTRDEFILSVPREGIHRIIFYVISKDAFH